MRPPPPTRENRLAVLTTVLRRSVLAVIIALALGGCNETLNGPANAREDKAAAASVQKAQADSVAPVLEMENPNRLPGRYIVRFKTQVVDSRALSKAIIRARGGRIYQVLEGLRGFWGELPDAAIEPLRQNPHVAYIEADVALHDKNTMDVTQYPSPNPLDRIDQRTLPLNSEYEYSNDGTGVHVWIIDDGVDRNAAELAGRIDETWFVTHNGKDPYAPCEGHGTAMATAVAGSYSGVAKNAIIHAARVDSDCNGGISTGAGSSAFEFHRRLQPSSGRGELEHHEGLFPGVLRPDCG